MDDMLSADADKAAVLAVLEAETAAWLRRDMDAESLFDPGSHANDPLEERHHSGGMNRNIDRHENKGYKDLPQHSPFIRFGG